MNYNSFYIKLFLRIVGIILAILALGYVIYLKNFGGILVLTGLVVYLNYECYQFIKRRFVLFNDFIEAVKYKDFSRWFNEDKGPADIQNLYRSFNQVNTTIKEINKQNEAQYVYLQKILAMVDVGIIAFNLDSGEVLWSNESFGKTLDLPSFKNINFVAKRQPQLFELLFDSYHKEAISTTISIKNERLKVLISSTIFNVDQNTFKLVVLQNIDTTLNKNESEAWKKLLSVMTHEIMNSIAPITSLADTLQDQLQLSLQNDENLNIADLSAGIQTIQSRGEGLLKFAKTYRSLSKITHLTTEKKSVADLFQSIELLMRPSLAAKNIDLSFKTETPNLVLHVDTHLIEQVLINLILNAKDAVKNQSNPKIEVIAALSTDRKIKIKVRDNGVGIPPEILDHIFVPFFTNKSTGSGIGLSLCKQIMLLHEGKISVKSVEGEGSVFSLSFPS